MKTQSKTRRTLFGTLAITRECPVSWTAAELERPINFCNQCQKNVYNLTVMTDKQVEAILRGEGSVRPCVIMKRRKDGSLVTDNCPVRLRSVRSKVRLAATTLIFLVAGLLFGQSVDAQGLIGAPSDPRYGMSGEVGIVGDFGYDRACDIGRAITFVAILLSPFVAIRHFVKTYGKTNVVKSFVLSSAMLVGIPVLVHLTWIWLINNTVGSMCGGGL